MKKGKKASITLSPRQRAEKKPGASGILSEIESLKLIHELEVPQVEIEMQNITSRKHSEDLLKESEEKYRILFNNSLFAVMLSTPDGRIMTANPAACQMLGRTEEEICKIGRDGIIDSSDPRLSEALKHRSLTSTFQGELTFLRKDGSKFPVELSTNIFKNSKGNFFTSMILVDISARKTNEEKLRLSEEKYRYISEQSGIGIGLYSTEGRILFFNNKALENLGGTSADYEGKSVVEVFGEEVGNEYIRRIKKAIRSGKGENYEDSVETASGQYWFLSNHTRICNSDNEVIGVHVLAQDITERKKAETNLFESEANLRSLIENTEGSIWSIDRKFQLIDANSGFYESFKKGTGQVLKPDDNVLESLPAQLKKEWRTYYRKGLSGQSFNIQTYTIPPFELLYMRYSFNPIKMKDGKVIGLSVIGQNITELKKAEEVLRDLTKHLEEARENERTRIAHDLHDDLGQKLTALNMDIFWLKSRIGVQTPLVESKIKQMVQLLNMTIDSVRKISFGLRPSILDDLGLRAAIEWQVKEFKKSTGISCSLSFHLKETELHSGCALMLFRLIQEALTNVTRHSEASEVSVKLDATVNSLKITIKDNGKGIENEKISSSKSLGLIGMKERIKVYSGDLKITGVKGKGTEIYVQIPLPIV